MLLFCEHCAMCHPPERQSYAHVKADALANAHGHANAHVHSHWPESMYVCMYCCMHVCMAVCLAVWLLKAFCLSGCLTVCVCVWLSVWLSGCSRCLCCLSHSPSLSLVDLPNGFPPWWQPPSRRGTVKTQQHTGYSVQSFHCRPSVCTAIFHLHSAIFQAFAIRQVSPVVPVVPSCVHGCYH